MRKKMFKMLYAICNPIYKAYIVILAKLLVRKLLQLTVAERRQYLFSYGFVMVEYAENDQTETRVYRHKSGLKVIDRHTHYKIYHEAS